VFRFLIEFVRLPDADIGYLASLAHHGQLLSCHDRGGPGHAPRGRRGHGSLGELRLMRQYLDMMRHVLEHGARKTDRTGTGTLSVFGHQLRFDLAEGFRW